jgi:hypothetical protein
MTGRYILNMGVTEFATRALLVSIEGTDAVPIFSADSPHESASFARDFLARIPPGTNGQWAISKWR